MIDSLYSDNFIAKLNLKAKSRDAKNYLNLPRKIR